MFHRTIRNLMIFAVLANSAAAFGEEEIVRIKADYKGDTLYDESAQFKIKYCTDKRCKNETEPSLHYAMSEEVIDLVQTEVGEKVKKYYESQGAEIDSEKSGHITIEKIIEQLAADTSDENGSKPHSERDRKLLQKFVEANKAHMVLSYIELSVSKNGGSGTTQFFLIYNAKTHWVSTIEKFMSAD